MSRIGPFQTKTHSRDQTFNVVKVTIDGGGSLVGYYDYGNVVSTLAIAAGVITVNLRETHKNIAVFIMPAEVGAADASFRVAVTDSDTFTVTFVEPTGEGDNWDVNLLIATTETITTARTT